jgi:thiol-disulfide isomerase/thioredoxin
LQHHGLAGWATSHVAICPMNLFKSSLLSILVLYGLTSSPVIGAEVLPGMRQFSHFPDKIDPNCREGQAKLYDECSDQLELLSQAMQRAKKEKKTVLVVYGAEWCIWCHVFAQHINGVTKEFTYTYGFPDDPERRDTSTLYEDFAEKMVNDAKTLNSFVADNFVVLDIDSMYAPNGEAVLSETGAIDHFEGGIPLVFTLNPDGKFADVFDHEKAEVRREFLSWYRGYDRNALLQELTRMKKTASQ